MKGAQEDVDGIVEQMHAPQAEFLRTGARVGDSGANVGGALCFKEAIEGHGGDRSDQEKAQVGATPAQAKYEASFVWIFRVFFGSTYFLYMEYACRDAHPDMSSAA